MKKVSQPLLVGKIYIQQSTITDSKERVKVLERNADGMTLLNLESNLQYRVTSPRNHHDYFLIE